jgi:restriction endonuclease S subunit
MTDWPVKTLGDVAKWGSGGTPRSGVAEYYDGDIPWCVIGDLTEGDVWTTEKCITEAGLSNSSAKIVEVGAILIAMYGASIGRTGVVRSRMATNQAIAFAFANEEVISSDYLLKYLQSQRSALNIAGRGSAQPNISQQVLKSWSIPVPPLEEQKRIVELLDAATVRVIELTACYEQARTHANNLFTSALREDLEGSPDWPVKTLGALCEVFDDGDWIESKDQAPSGVRLIQTGNVGDGEFKDRSDKARFISESTFSRLRCTEIFPGDLLVSRLPDPVGRACLIPDTGSKMITAVDCTIMRPRKDIMLPQFLVFSTQTSSYREQVSAKITGTTRDRISRSHLFEVQVSVPTLEEQAQIVARLDSMKSKTSEIVAAYDAKLTEAKNLRQSILEAAFAGEL